ncbi:MAG: permease [Anaerolineae bacterium]|nr:permease [Anaerolineae bacterium]
MDVGSVIGTFSTRFLGIFVEAVSFLLLGSLFSGIIAVFLSDSGLPRLMPRNPIAATIVGSMMGFVFPVCECGVVPVTRRLYQKGLPVSVGITFLLAAPVMNPIVLASTYAAFGWGPILIGRYVITLIIAITVGLLFTLQNRPQRVVRPEMLATVSGGSVHMPAAPAPIFNAVPLLPGLKQVFQVASEEFFEMGRYLVIGSLLASAMQTVIPQETLKALATNPVNSVIVLAALAFLLSVCSTVDAFLALSFARTFTTGSILTFLTFGPMVDIKSAMMYLGVFRRRTVVYMVVLPFLISTLIGIWLNLNVRF